MPAAIKFNVVDIYIFDLQALNKKEHKNGACSPDSVEDTADYQLTPTTERKYTKIDEQFQLLMQQKNILSANNNRVNFEFYVYTCVRPI